MSWFKRTPKSKTPDKPKPHRTSPISDQMLKVAKEKTSPKQANKEQKNE
jgi:hypothetical protein